ncbi:MAG: hypothetical protein F6K39_31645 [Okeania sp. SIO3B3]|nr:hypothetical protein [Okeania sp. SIO3B3]
MISGVRRTESGGKKEEEIESFSIANYPDMILLNHPASSFIIGALEDWQKNKQIK